MWLLLLPSVTNYDQDVQAKETLFPKVAFSGQCFVVVCLFFSVITATEIRLR